MLKKRILQTIFCLLFSLALSRVALEFLPRYIVALSPTVHLGNSVKIFTGQASFFVAFPSLILIVAAFIFRKRFFCFFICPVGFLQDISPSLKKVPTYLQRIPYCNYCFFSIMVIVSLCGLNMLGVLDPLVMYARFIALFQESFVVSSLWFLFPLVLIVALSTIYKRVWCFYGCPLGTFHDFCYALKEKIKKTASQKHDASRRQILVSVLGGIAVAFIGKRFASADVASDVIRPPGALPEGAFKQACVRCGNCVKACLTDGLQPVVWESGWDGLGTPRLVPRIGECDEHCNLCGYACPTGAIAALPLAEKKEQLIGVARVEKQNCLAWDGGHLCFICAEFCPYLAINAEMRNQNVPCPVVKEEICRGCGLCEKQCPTHAIRVYRRSK